MAKTGMVEIEKDGMTARVMPSSVERWGKNGWTLVEDGSSDDGTKVVEADTPVATSEDAVVVDDNPDETEE